MTTQPVGQSPDQSNELQLQEIPCPLCGETETRQVVKAVDNQWGIAGEFTVVKCIGCRHRYMNPRPAVECLSNCYPTNYGPHQLLPQPHNSEPVARASEVTAVHQPSPQTPWYLRYLPLRYIPGLKSFYFWLTNERSQIFPQPFLANGDSCVEGKSADRQPRAFELGCAAGAYLSQLRERGWDVEGVEPGDGPVAAARAVGLNVHHGTLDTAAAPAEAFDFAASWMVLEHVPSPRVTLAQLLERLKPGGQLAISVPNAGCWEPGFFGTHWDAWDLPRHLHHFTPRSIRQLLSECGFTEIKIVHQRTLLNVFGSVGITITKRWPDSRLGQWFLRYPHSPKLPVQLAATPIAHALAFLRQGGRLTVTAVRPVCEPSLHQKDAL